MADLDPELHPRERQIMDVIYRRGPASVADVIAELPDPPSYSAVRTILHRLERKGLLRHHRAGLRFVYRSTARREEARRSALHRLMSTFFDGSPTKAVAAILDQSAADLSDKDLADLADLVNRARRKER